MKVLVGLSGGVDSSATVARLLGQGHEVVAATLVMARGGTPVPTADALARARDLCASLDVEHHAVDVSDAFERRVCAPFAEAYAAGLTPSPCVACNRSVKVAALLDLADSLGCDRVATGHYVRIVEGGDSVARVARAEDLSKDQSYYLCGLSPDQVARLLAPLSASTKFEVRAEARAASLAAADAPDSMGVCFAPGGDYRAFLRGRRPDAFEPGDIVDEGGCVLGRHGGIAGFTVGQRKGLNIRTGGGPWFVSSIDPETRQVRVGTGVRPLRASFPLTGTVLSHAPAWYRGRYLLVQTHHRGRPEPASITVTAPGEALVELAGPGTLAAPGQTCAVYDGDTVVAGGTIA